MGMLAPLWALLAAASSAHAHAPLARGVWIEGGEVLAVRMPSFGLVLRAREGSLAYACDAQLGLGLGDGAAPLLAMPDGSMRIGATDGVVRLDADGCVASPEQSLAGETIVALAAHPDDARQLFAATAGDAAAIHRSLDGGLSWELRGRLPPGADIDGLAVEAGEPPRLQLSRSGSEGGARLSSPDAGLSFQLHDTGEVVRLLAADGAGGHTWGVANDPATREARLMRQDDDAAPWVEVHRVRFFGGFALERGGGRLWLADEAGGLFRSDDDGESFETLQPNTAFACLVHADGRLWGCTPGTVSQPAIAVSDDGGERFEPVLRFTDVQAQVACNPSPSAPPPCPFAWAEWQADVLGEGVTGADAPSTTTPVPEETPPAQGAAGGAAPMAASQAVPTTPPAVDDDTPVRDGTARRRMTAAQGCQVGRVDGARGNASTLFAAAWLALVAVSLRCRRFATMARSRRRLARSTGASYR